MQASRFESNVFSASLKGAVCSGYTWLSLAHGPPLGQVCARGPSLERQRGRRPGAP